MRAGVAVMGSTRVWGGHVTHRKIGAEVTIGGSDVGHRLEGASPNRVAVGSERRWLRMLREPCIAESARGSENELILSPGEIPGQRQLQADAPAQLVDCRLVIGRLGVGFRPDRRLNKHLLESRTPASSAICKAGQCGIAQWVYLCKICEIRE